MNKLDDIMDFVSFEIAKKLKEKEFDWETSNVYERNTLACRYEDYPKPTISQVLKWLREEKNIFILIDIRTDLSWFYEVWGIENSLFPLGTTPYQKQQSYELAALAGIEYVLDNLI